MRTGVLAALLIVAVAPACSDSEDAYRLVVEVRASMNAPADFGVQPGDLIPKASVEVEWLDGDRVPISAEADDEGKATIELPGPGRYQVFISAETNDELCVWTGGDTLTVDSESTSARLDDVGVACQ